jgi:hypothetical protein
MFSLNGRYQVTPFEPVAYCLLINISDNCAHQFQSRNLGMEIITPSILKCLSRLIFYVNFDYMFY